MHTNVPKKETGSDWYGCLLPPLYPPEVGVKRGQKRYGPKNFFRSDRFCRDLRTESFSSVCTSRMGRMGHRRAPHTESQRLRYGALFCAPVCDRN